MADWIKVHRRLMDSDVFDNPITLKVWVWLLLKAQFKDKVLTLEIGKAYEDVPVKRGSVLFGRIKNSKDLKLTPSMVYRQVKKLEKLGKVTVKSSSHYSIITICKYELYQVEKEKAEQHVNNTRTADEQQAVQHVNTNKNVNNEKNASTAEIGIEEIKKIANNVWNKDKAWLEALCIGNGLKMEDCKDWMLQFNLSVSQDSHIDFDEKRYKKMFSGWIRMKLGGGQKVVKMSTKENEDKAHLRSMGL